MSGYLASRAYTIYGGASEVQKTWWRKRAWTEKSEIIRAFDTTHPNWSPIVNFDLSEEQQLLKDSVERFVSDSYDLDTRQTLSKNDAGFSDNITGKPWLSWVGWA